VGAHDSTHRHLVHDFNNLVFLMTAYTEQLLEQVPRDHPLAHDLAILAETARRMEELSPRIRALERCADCAQSCSSEAASVVDEDSLVL
jgi:hypothetical protein